MNFDIIFIEMFLHLFAIYVIMIPRGDIMLKVISGKNYICSGNEDNFKLSSDCSMLIFVTEGYAFFDKQRVDFGEGYFSLERDAVTVKTAKDVRACFVCFELEGSRKDSAQRNFGDVGLTTPTACFSVYSPDRASAITNALCPDVYTSHSQAFDEAAASMLLSLINATDSARLYGNPYVDGAIKYVNANIDKEIKVEELAAALGTERMYLRNLFVNHVGMSTMDYIMSVRIDRAKELLKNRRFTVKDVAASVGYSDVLCFSKAFKKRVGTSPSEYRESLSSDVEKKSSANRQVPVYIL